jgi:TPR repeat protein
LIPENSEVSDLLARARALIRNGDILSARLVLRRADRLGDPRVALELGGTYDPLVLKLINVYTISLHADVVQARKWYERAADLGATDAVQRLKALALLDQ